MAILGNKTCLGVDIDAGDIRVVELRRVGGKYEVLQAARIPIPGNGDVSAALSGFLLDTETSPGMVVGSLPTHLCSVKLAQVPKAKPADLARMVRFEAESQIPLPLSDIVWDYRAQSTNGDTTCQVVIGGARRSDVDGALRSLEQAKLSPDALAISVLAAVEAVALPGGEPVLLALIGAEWADLCVVQGDDILACRTVRLGGNKLTEAFAQDLGVDAEEAEEIKRTRGFAQVSALSGDGSGVSAIETWAENLALEIRRSVVSMPSREPDRRPQRAVLVGEAADVPGLAEDLSRRAGLQFAVADPWTDMTLSPVAAHTMSENPTAFTVATGLAKTGLASRPIVNLMPHHRAEERIRRRKEFATLAGLGGLAAILLILLLAGSPGLREKSSELSLLKSEVMAVRRDIQRAGPDLRASADNVTQTVSSIQSADNCPLELLRRMSTVLPRSVWLSEFAFQSNKTAVIKGSALSNSAVADAVDMLNQLDLFKDVTLDFSNLTKSGQGYEFQITCSLPPAKSLAGRSSTGKPRSVGSGRTGIVVQ